MASVFCGIVGLPNVGKSTLFNALLKKQVAAAQNYPFTTIEPNVGVVEVPDSRLQALAETVANENSKSEIRNSKQISNSNDQKLKNEDRIGRPPIVPAIVKFVDIAGLVKGAHKGEGLGNQFLSHIREVDAIVFVVRDFKNENVIRAGSENPKEDMEVLKEELLLKDLETIESQKSKLKGQNYNLKFKSAIEKLQEAIGRGIWAKDVGLDNQESAEVRNLFLLTDKPVVVVLNSDEDDLNKDPGIENGMRICAKLEEELASLSEEEQKQYLAELGISESGLDRLAKKAYQTLGLATFLTAGPKEVRAWTIKEGSLAPQAAGVIHTDFERGFIAADVVDWRKFVEVGGWQKARSSGVVRTIGKGEEIKEGMVVEFRFSV